MTKSIYTRLTRKKRGFFGYTQLWLAPDHVLLVTNSRFSERYQRFFLADIQAIVVNDWPARARLPLLAVAAVWLALLAVSSSAFGKGFCGVMALLFLVLVAVDFLRGSHCRCLLQTAVSRTVLLPVAHQRHADTFLSTMTPLIQAAQGALAAEPSVLETFPHSVEAAPAPFIFDRLAEAPITLFGTVVNSPGRPPALPAEHRSYTWILFGFLLLTAPAMWAALSHPRQAIGVLWSIYLGELILSAMVLVQDRAHPWKLPYLLAAFAAVLLLIDAGTVSGAAGFSEFVSLLRQGTLPAEVHYGWLSASQATLFSTGWRTVIGVAGLGAWWGESASSRRKLKST